MFKFKILILFIVAVQVMAGCAGTDSSVRKSQFPYIYKTGSMKEKQELIRQYMTRGAAFEKEGRLTSALEQYKLALTVEPENSNALQNKDRVMNLLRQKAQFHYNRGVEFDNMGQYEAGREEYLRALQNWPDHKYAKRRLTERTAPSETGEYIIHTLKYGESVSIISKLYYDDVRKYDVIGKFNNMKDVTKIKSGDRLKIPTIEGITVADLKRKQSLYLKSGETIKIKPEKQPDKIPFEYTPDEPAPQEISDETTPVEAAVAEIPEVEPPSTETVKVTPDEIKEDPDLTAMDLPSEDEVAQEIQAQEKEPSEETVAAIEATRDELEKKRAEEEIARQVSTFYQQGKAMLKQKKYAEAVKVLSKAHGLDSQNQSLRGALFQAHFQNGLVLFNKKTYLEARDQFNAALEYDPSCDKCRENLEKSEAAYKKTHYDLGTHYFGNENLEKAIEEWKRVKAVDPDYKQVTPNLKRAEALYKRWIEIKESSAK